MTAISRSTAVVTAVLALLASGGCGGTALHRSTASASVAGAGVPAAPGSFSWLRAQAPVAGWRVARTSNGATLAYPPSWRTLGGDRGSASAALLDPSGRYLGYLNLTPREGAESRASWVSFRARHNRAEGDREVRVLGSAAGLRFRSGAGTCLTDSYTTSTDAHYVEVACLIGGASPAVVVGAAPPDDWRTQGATIERAISSA